MKYKGVDEFLEAVLRAITPKLRSRFCALRTGVVVGASGSTARVRLSGDAEATPMRSCCPVEAGNAVLVIGQKTKLYIIGVIR